MSEEKNEALKPKKYNCDLSTISSIEENEYIVCFNPQKFQTPKRLQFLCCVCNKLINGFQKCVEHLNDKKYKVDHDGKAKKIRYYSCRTCSPVESISEITTLLKTEGSKNALTQSDVAKRMSVCNRIEKLLQDAGLSAVRVVMYGSSVTGLGFQDSDLNIGLEVDNYENIDPSVTDASSFFFWFCDHWIDQSEQFENIEPFYYRRNPEFSFKDKESGYVIMMKKAFDRSVASTDLNQDFMRCDPRFKELFMAFRSFTRVCMIADKQAGGIPPFNLMLFVVHFLQQTQPPVLPIIKIESSNQTDGDYEDKVIRDPEREESATITREQVATWKSDNQQSLGDLFLDFIRYYMAVFSRKSLVVNIRQKTPMSREHKEWGSRRFAIEDPFIIKDNKSRMAANKVMGYFLDCLEQTYHYLTPFCRPHRNGKWGVKKDKEKQSAASTKSAKGDKTDQTSDKYTEKSSKSDATPTMETIENPDTHSQAKNSDPGNMNEDGRSSSDVEVEDEIEITDKKNIDSVQVLENTEITEIKTINTVLDITGSMVDIELNSPSKEHRPIEVKLKTSKTIDVKSSSNVSLDDKIVPSNESTSDIEIPLNDIKSKPSVESISNVNTPSSDTKHVTQIEPSKVFAFSIKTFTPKQSPPMFCIECGSDDHFKARCDLANFSYSELPPMDPKRMALLTLVLARITQTFEISLMEFNVRRDILNELEQHLKLHVQGDSRLNLFGSSVNGFGFKGSDMDMCLRFSTDEPPIDVDPKDVIKKVHKALEKNSLCHKVYSIKTAKVPIVKFCYQLPGFEGPVDVEGDISFYNSLALRNSLLISTYALIDNRVRILGFAVKGFAKVCEIGDASRGSLSSYAYILMLLHYLQRCDPPVLPVLQELYEEDRKPEWIVDGWNTWFLSDIQEMQSRWPHFGENKKSIGELFVGFFRYYIEEFDFLKEVVAMKQSKKLYKFEKQWSSSVMAIEDPFNLSHNLGGGITKNMFGYIRSCFAHARVFYHTPNEEVTSKLYDFLEIQAYLFNRVHLVGEEEVPQDGLCRRCGKIGHFATNCAEKKAIDHDKRKMSRKEGDDADDESDSEEEDEKGSKKRGHKNQDSNERSQKNIKCFYCHRMGHMKADCPRRKEEEKYKEYEPGHTPVGQSRKNNRSAPSRRYRQQYDARQTHPVSPLSHDQVQKRQESRVPNRQKTQHLVSPRKQQFKNQSAEYQRSQQYSNEEINTLFNTNQNASRQLEQPTIHYQTAEPSRGVPGTKHTPRQVTKRI